MSSGQLHASLHIISAVRLPASLYLLLPGTNLHESRYLTFDADLLDSRISPPAIQCERSHLTTSGNHLMLVKLLRDGSLKS